MRRPQAIRVGRLRRAVREVLRRERPLSVLELQALQAICVEHNAPEAAVAIARALRNAPSMKNERR